jgi:hypothetical protein
MKRKDHEIGSSLSKSAWFCGRFSFQRNLFHCWGMHQRPRQPLLWWDLASWIISSPNSPFQDQNICSIIRQSCFRLRLPPGAVPAMLKSPPNTTHYSQISALYFLLPIRSAENSKKGTLIPLPDPRPVLLVTHNPCSGWLFPFSELRFPHYFPNCSTASLSSFFPHSFLYLTNKTNSSPHICRSIGAYRTKHPHILGHSSPVRFFSKNEYPPSFSTPQQLHHKTTRQSDYQTIRLLDSRHFNYSTTHPPNYSTIQL